MSDRKLKNVKKPENPDNGNHRQDIPEELETGFNNLFENLPIGVAITTSEGITVDANPALITMLGYDSREEALRTPVSDHYMDPADRERFLLARKKGVVTDFDVLLKRKDGTPIWVSINSAGQTTQSDLPHLLTTFRDITDRKQVEEERAQLIAILETTSDLVSIATLDGQISFMNIAGKRLVGWAEDENLDRHSIPDIHPDWASDVVRTDGIPAAIKNHVWEGETALLRSDGTEIPVSQVIMAHKAPNGEVEFLSTIMRDITDRKLAEKELRESEERYRALFDHADDAIFLIYDDKFVDCNDKTLEMFGRTREEIIGRTPADFSPEMQLYGRKSREEAQLRLTAALAGNSQLFEWEHFRPDGMPFFVEINLTPINLKGEDHIFAVVRDITERRNTERSFRLAQYSIEHSPEGILLIGSDGKFLSVNNAACQLADYSRDELLGMSVYDIAPEITEESWPSFWRELREEGSRTFEGGLIVRGGHISPIEVTANIQEYEGDEFIFGSLRDISSRKQAESTLQQSEEKYRLLADNVSDVLWILGVDLRWTYLSPSVERQRGFSVEEAMALKLEDVIAPSSLEYVRQVLREEQQIELEDGFDPLRTRTLEIEIYRKDGTTIWTESKVSILRDENGILIGFLGISRDISDRKKTEEALRFSEQRFETVFKSSPDPIIISSMQTGLLVEVNEGFERLTDYKAEEVIGQKALDLDLWAEPEQRDTLLALIRSEGRVKDFEMQYRTKQGVLRDAELAAEIIDLHGESHLLIVVRDITDRKKAENDLRAKEAQEALVLRSLPMAFYIAQPFGGYGGMWVSEQIDTISGFTAEEFEKNIDLWVSRLHPEDRDRALAEFDTVTERNAIVIEYRWQSADGEYKWFMDNAVLIRDEHGEPKEIIGTWLDITERKKTEQELREKDEQLVQSQKMEAVGQLAGGVAHDFNNMLSVIMGYSDLAFHKLDQADPLRRNFEHIQAAAEKAARLTQQLLIFSRKQTVQPKALDLNTIVNSTGKMLHRLIGEDIVLKTELAKKLGIIKADQGQIDQIIVNLAVNARDAMPQGGELVIRTEDVDIGEGQTSAHKDIEPGPYVNLTISDTGYGMDEATVSRIFEPFFTTKVKGKGTGLGLATVYGIVQQSGGFIHVQSEQGEGTTFEIFFPRVEETIEAEEVMDWADMTSRTGESVLVVEDDDGVRGLVVEILGNLGYKVIEKRNGDEALLHCEQYQGPIDIMLTDIVMPKMSGPQLAERVTPLHPEMKIVFMSGYTEDAIGKHGVLDSDLHFIEKPFTAEGLAMKLREALEATESDDT